MSLDTKDIVALFRKNPILSSCALVSVLLLLVVYFRFGLIASAQVELDQKNAEGKKYHDNVLNAGQLRAQMAVVAAANRIVRDRAMHPGNLAKNLQYFYRIEAETGVKYTDLKPGAVSVENKLLAAPISGRTVPAPAANKSGMKNYVPVNYAITVQGAFPQLVAFLRRLEQGGYFYRLNTMIISTVGPTISFNLNIDFLGEMQP